MYCLALHVAFSKPLSTFFLSIQIKEMTKELDILLQSIEEKGGFRDACTVLQKTAVESLEKGLAALSQKCIMWRVIFNTLLFFLYYLQA